MFVARPPAGPPAPHDLHLMRAQRRAFCGPAEFLADSENRARVGEYLADLARPHGIEVPAALFAGPPAPALGHSYGEMAQPLIEAVAPADEPVDLLVLAFAVHDLRPARQTAAYLSHVAPGAPMAFAICDQGSAAAFTALRVIRDYAALAEKLRALLVVVEQASLPYDCPVPLPSEHRAVAMLYGAGTAVAPLARVTGVRQHAGVPPDAVADLAAAEFAVLAGGHQRPGLVLGDALAALWTGPGAGPVLAMPPGQPSTSLWWGLIDELASAAERPELLILADYDPNLRYLCLTAFLTGLPPGRGPG